MSASRLEHHRRMIRLSAAGTDLEALSTASRDAPEEDGVLEQGRCGGGVTLRVFPEQPQKTLPLVL